MNTEHEGIESESKGIKSEGKGMKIEDKIISPNQAGVSIIKSKNKQF